MGDATEQVRVLLGRTKLRDIGYFQMVAFRGRLGEDGGRPVIGPGPVPGAEEEATVEHEVTVLQAPGGARLLIRLTTAVLSPAGEVRVGAQAEYEFDGSAEELQDPDVEHEFVNKVAVMAIAPYIRSAVSDLSTRVLGRTITLKVLRLGELTFGRTTDGGRGSPELDGESV